jgi:type II secretory pathway component GspD/PulD (secretin)
VFSDVGDVLGELGDEVQRIEVLEVAGGAAEEVLAAPEYRDAVRDFVNKLDRPGRQVLIAAVIAEVELTDQLSLDANINVVLQALAQKTNLRVLQEPSVFTSDNQEASFFQGQDVPILQSTTTSPEATIQSNSVNYQSVGIGLNVRPRITIEGDVDLEINLEISNINAAGSAAVGGSSINSPVFDRRETTTEVIVKNGQTIVISGIIKDQESRVRRKVPILGDIPLFGELFKSYDDQNTRTELLAFITPLVVDNPSENDANYNEVARSRLQEIGKSLKEQKKGRAEERARGGLLLERYKHAQPQSQPGAG